MNKSEKRMRLEMIKAIEAKHNAENENIKLKRVVKKYSKIIKSLINCENCNNDCRDIDCIKNNYRDWTWKDLFIDKNKEYTALGDY